MHTYLKLQEAPQTDNITEDGHVGAKLPWPVVADEEGTVVVPSSLLGMAGVVGFQRDLAVMHIDLLWKDAFADPQKTVGMYLVSSNTEGNWGVSLSAVDHVEVLQLDHELPVDR
jgi:hypothetical protein